MKLDIETQRFHTNEIEGRESYVVANTSHMMRILGESLYEDKILACIREISTNAFESHFRANNAEPFHIYLPTSDNPKITWRDFGTGLSKEQLSNLYKVFGASDKGDSNDYTGCLGLGSKAPFAYHGNGGTFITTSYIDGTKHTVVNAKDSRGKPTMVFLKSESTNEPNGVEIAFDVLPEDVTEFAQKAAKVFQWFKTRPICKQGHYENMLDEYDYDYDFPTWKLQKRASSTYPYYKNKCKAIMGQVAYPINLEHFKGDYARVLELGNLHLFFEIGEIEMSPSREGLQYHEHTINAIKKRLDEIIKYFRDYVSQKIKDCESLWDSRILLAELVNGELSFLNGLVSKEVEWKNQKVSTLVEIKGCNLTKFEKQQTFRYNTDDVVKQHNGHQTVRASKRISLYYNDMKRGAITACKDKLRKDKDIDIIYLVRDKDELNHFKSLLGAVNGAVKPCSDLPYNASTKQRGNISTVFAFNEQNRRYYCRARNCWVSTSVEIDNETGVYCPMYKWEIDIDGFRFSPNEIKQLTESISKAGIKIPKLIGVRRNATKKFEKNNNWTRIDKWLEEKIHELLTDELKVEINDYQIASKIANKTFFRKLFPYLTKSESEIYKLAEMSANMLTIEQNARWLACVEVDKYFLRTTDESKIDSILNTRDITEMEKIVDTKYPMIKYVQRAYSYEEQKFEEIANYINLIDKAGV